MVVTLTNTQAQFHCRIFLLVSLTVSLCEDSLFKRCWWCWNLCNCFPHSLHSDNLPAYQVACSMPLPMYLPVVFFSMSSIDYLCPVHKALFDLLSSEPWTLVYHHTNTSGKVLQSKWLVTIKILPWCGIFSKESFESFLLLWSTLLEQTCGKHVCGKYLKNTCIISWLKVYRYFIY